MNLGANQIGDEGAKALAGALSSNRTLRSLNLSYNKIGKEGTKVLSDALEHNYTLVTLYGLESSASGPRITQYLARNKEINDCLASLTAFKKTGALDSEAFSEDIKKLEQWMPWIGTDQSLLPDDHAIEENYQLLNSLGYLTREDDPQSRAQAWRLLETPFSHPNLQHIADLAKRTALSLAKEEFEKVTADEYTARSQWLLYSVKDDLHRPELESMVKSALMRLKDPSKEVLMADLKTIEEATGAQRLLSFDKILAIAEDALADLDPDAKDEAKLLQMLLTQKSYHPVTTQYFWQSPAFLSKLGMRYPGDKDVSSIGKLFIESCYLARRRKYCKTQRSYIASVVAVSKQGRTSQASPGVEST